MPYVVADPIAATRLESLNRNARSLTELYRAGVPRRRIYEEMVDEILGPVRDGKRVCAVFYGHPGVYVEPSHEAVRRAREEGFEARMLPGVSAEDCLVADLGVDPGESGWQSWEATSFLLHGFRPDPTAGLVLWQVDGIGKLDWDLDPDPRGLAGARPTCWSSCTRPSTSSSSTARRSTRSRSHRRHASVSTSCATLAERSRRHALRPAATSQAGRPRRWRERIGLTQS